MKEKTKTVLKTVGQSSAMLLAALVTSFAMLKACELSDMEQEKRTIERVEKDMPYYHSQKEHFAQSVMEKMDKTRGNGQKAIDLAVKDAMSSPEASDLKYRDALEAMSGELRLLEKVSKEHFGLVVQGYAHATPNKIISGLSKTEEVAEMAGLCTVVGLKVPTRASTRVPPPLRAPEARQRGN